MFVGEETAQGREPTASRRKLALRGSTLGYGRFMQTDPIGYADGLNMYDYVGGDPVNSFDPDGTGKVGVVVRLVQDGVKAVSSIYSMAQARMLSRQGIDVKMINRQKAEQLAASINKSNANVTKPERHVLPNGKNGGVHVHPETRDSGHIFYGLGAVLLLPDVVSKTIVGIVEVLDAVDDAANPFNESGLSECQTLGACPPKKSTEHGSVTIIRETYTPTTTIGTTSFLPIPTVPRGVVTVLPGIGGGDNGVKKN